ncbi:MAG: lipase family protein [Gammaproteobacteria bacterium]|nr:lipase family protein [Gammaproteobacteria bacterium]
MGTKSCDIIAVSPNEAAKLANKVYDSQSDLLISLFLKDPIFSQAKNNSKHLKAKVGFRVINVTDGFGICARGGVGREKDLFIIFRGTTTKNYGADLISDARFGVETSKTGLPVHIGFNHAFSSMLPAIEEFLKANADVIGTVHVIGHSLGGAVATLTADWLSGRRPGQVKLYTFGCPKAGLEFFAWRLSGKLGSKNIYRVHHSTDIVPMVPVYPFAHSPTNHCGYQLPSNGLVSFSAHKIANYAKSVESASWGMLEKTGELTAYQNSIEHWLKSDKPLNPADPKTWEWINAGLTWVLRKVIGGAMAILQSPVMSAISLADKIAWILHKGFDLSTDASGWVLSIMRKIMQALGMKVAKAATELTRQFMQIILRRLIARMSREASQAIRALMVR